jgi:DNA processing protein
VRAVVVPEAGLRSGSLITARAALDLGREVLAVPGPVTSPASEGANQLIADGARLTRGAADVVEALGLPDRCRLLEGLSAREETPRSGLPGGRSGVLERVLGGLEAGAGTPLDALAERTGLGPADLLSALVRLEARGLVRAAEQGCWCRT